MTVLVAAPAGLPVVMAFFAETGRQIAERLHFHDPLHRVVNGIARALPPLVMGLRLTGLKVINALED